VVIPKTPMHHIPIELDPADFRTVRKILNLITAPSAAERCLPSTCMISILTTFDGPAGGLTA
jgi:hypothetical protein